MGKKNKKTQEGPKGDSAQQAGGSQQTQQGAQQRPQQGEQQRRQQQEGAQQSHGQQGAQQGPRQGAQQRSQQQQQAQQRPQQQQGKQQGSQQGAQQRSQQQEAQQRPKQQQPQSGHQQDQQGWSEAQQRRPKEQQQRHRPEDQPQAWRQPTQDQEKRGSSQGQQQSSRQGQQLGSQAQQRSQQQQHQDQQKQGWSQGQHQRPQQGQQHQRPQDQPQAWRQPTQDQEKLGWSKGQQQRPQQGQQHQRPQDQPQAWRQTTQDQEKRGWSQGQQQSSRQGQQLGSQAQHRSQQQQHQDQPKQGWSQGQQQRPQQGQQHQQTYQQVPSQPLKQMHEQRSPSTTSSLSSSSTSSKSGVLRGTIGRPKIVETNYLRLNLDKMPSVAYHYDVTITPDRPKKFFRPAFEQFNRQHFPNIVIAFDGSKSCYTVERLPIENEFVKEVTTADSNNRTLTFKIAIKSTESMEIDLTKLRTYFKDRIWDKPMRALQCLEVVMASPCHNVAVRGGRSFYVPPDSNIDLRDGYELWIGLYQAMILGEEPLLNVDISHKSFPKATTVLRYLQENIRNFDATRQLDTRARYDLIDFLKGLRITYKTPESLPKDYSFLDVSEESASKRTFLHQESGTRMTIADYFQKERKIRLKYPNLNCLLVGSSVKSIALPIEFCEIGLGQAIKKKDGERQVQNMIRYAATSTNERKKKIMSLLSRFQHNNNNLVQRFGIRIDPNFIDVPMRVLTAPNIEYFNREILRVSTGSWRMNPNTQFLDTKKKPHKWAIIYSKDSRSINYNILDNKLAKFLKDAARGVNLEIDPKPFIDSFADIDSKLLELKRNKFDLVVVVIPFRGATYAKIKQTAELKHGILTQCIKEETVDRRCNAQTALNLLLKINAKLNGTNHKIADSSHVALKNVMFLGADVTHPSPDQREIPSVVGVAASHDVHGACYNMQYRLQKSTLEEIEDMASIIKQHLSVYFKKLGKYPEHIIYYRDGVSDGQFEKVRDLELRSMRAGCAHIKINPKITCIIAVKRHHTRFFPKDVNQRDKFNNVEPGTVVDRVITHPSEVQFFMVSHQSIQGTAKPTRYNVIHDDAKMDINILQTLTHNLCHLFPRCNRAVSYPTPVYLAHLVAFRGRKYVEGTVRFGELKAEYAKRLVRPEFMESNPMYFV